MTGPAVVATVRMTSGDFDKLCQDVGRTADFTPERASRLLTVDGLPLGRWQCVYWVGDDWVNVLLARAYLEAVGAAYQVADDETVWDNGERLEMLGWVILTDYITPEIGPPVPGSADGCASC